MGWQPWAVRWEIHGLAVRRSDIEQEGFLGHQSLNGGEVYDLRAVERPRRLPIHGTRPQAQRLSNVGGRAGAHGGREKRYCRNNGYFRGGCEQGVHWEKCIS